MALYKVYYKLGFSHSARTMNLDYPSESAAKEGSPAKVGGLCKKFSQSIKEEL